MHDQLIHDLTRRRRELAHDMNQLLNKVDALRSDIEAVDRIMMMYRPDMKPSAIPALNYRPQPDWAKRGEITRHVYAALRNAPQGLTTAEITAHVMQERGLVDDNVVKHRKRIYKALDQQRKQGKLSAKRDGDVYCWRIAGYEGEL